MSIHKSLLVACAFAVSLCGAERVVAEESCADTNHISGVPFLKLAAEQLASMTGRVDLAKVEEIVIELRRQEAAFRESYALLAYEACRKIAETGGVASTPLEVKAEHAGKFRVTRGLAASALAGNGVSLETRMKLLPFLPTSRPSLASADDRAEWSVERAMAARWWLKTWRDIEQAAKNDDGHRDEPLMSVPPPVEANLPDGGIPDMIADPVLKKKWLDAIARNNAKIESTRKQLEIEMQSKAFRYIAERQIMKYYAVQPQEVDELRKLLELYVDDSALRGRIITNVCRVWSNGPPAAVKDFVTLGKVPPEN